MKVFKFPSHKPGWEDQKEIRQSICSALLDAGLSAIEAADLLLYAAYDLHRYAEGADEQREGWQERADRSFQKAVAGFCVESAHSGLEFDKPGYICLSYP